MKHRIVVLFFIIMCLSMGVIIYFLTRSEHIYLNQWIGPLRDTSFYLFLQTLVHNLNLPYWVVYSLPDALWMMALIMIVLMIWEFKLDTRSIFWVALSTLVGVLLEISQAIHVLPGTYDNTDLIFIFIGALIPISISILKLHTCKTTQSL